MAFGRDLSIYRVECPDRMALSVRGGDAATLAGIN